LNISPATQAWIARTSVNFRPFLPGEQIMVRTRDMTGSIGTTAETGGVVIEQLGQRVIVTDLVLKEIVKALKR
jgi:hypothetical protein